MPNTYVNKVITGAGNTLIDLSQDTVTSASHIIGGRVGHLADGSSVSGTGSKTVTYSLSNGVSTNVSPDSIITGEGLCLRLLAPSGYVLSNISVTMGGVDITNSAFTFDTKEEPTLATKSITANGTYTASSDSADGYSSVTVNVASGVSPTLTTKSITANGTYNASSDNADGYSSVTVNVSGGGGSSSKSGTYTPTQTYNTSGNRAITTIANIGFTPSRFYLYPTSNSDVNGTKGAIAFSQYEEYVPGKHRRFSVYTSNTSGGRGVTTAGTSWTTETTNFLYLSNGTVYIRTATNYAILGNVEYTWVAYE